MEYTQRIRNLREDNDYNQTLVAKAIHVAQTTYDILTQPYDKCLSSNVCGFRRIGIAYHPRACPFRDG